MGTQRALGLFFCFCFAGALACFWSARNSLWPDLTVLSLFGLLLFSVFALVAGIGWLIARFA